MGNLEHGHRNRINGEIGAATLNRLRVDNWPEVGVVDWDATRPHSLLWVCSYDGPEIEAKHVGTAGTHRDESDTLWLDGKATRPQ